MNPSVRGIVVPLITPFGESGHLDRPHLTRLIDHTVAGGVEGLFLLGTTGEGPSLGRRMRAEIVTEACLVAKGRVPVMVAVTDTAILDSVELACVAHQAGASAIVTAGPAYYPLSQKELLGYLEQLAESSPLPVFLYNMPSHTHLWFEPQTVALAAQFSNVAGLKDSSGDLQYLLEVSKLVKGRSNFSVLIGPEELMAEAVMSGVNGGVNGGANLFPALYVRLYAAAKQQDHDEVSRLQQIVMTISSEIYGRGGYLQGMKCAASHLGLCDNVLATPLRAWDSQQCADMQETVETITSRVSSALS